MTFNHIIGHDEIKNILTNSIKTNTLSHAHLFVGEDGIGKSVIARALSIKILGKNENKDYADIINWRINKGKKSIGIKEIQKVIEIINKKPYEGDKKVIIIYNADEVTEEAQNSFLKTIEEPPKGVYIILLAEKAENILDTIKSRCQVHNLNRLNNKQMDDFLNREFSNLSLDEIKLLSNFSEGIPGRAIRFKNDLEFQELRKEVLIILNNIGLSKKFTLDTYEEFFLKHKNNWEEVFNCFISYIRDIIIYKEVNKDGLIVNEDKLSSIRDMSGMFSLKKLNDIINIIKNAGCNLSDNVNYTLVCNLMLLKMQEV